MSKMDRYIQHLAYLDLNHLYEKHARNYAAFCSKSQLRFCNRVVIDEHTSANDILAIKEYYSMLPFSFWINEKNTQGIQLVKSMGFNFNSVYPLMTANLHEITASLIHEKIAVKRLENETDILNLWVSLVLKAYQITAFTEFQKFVKSLLKQANFYIGYYNNEPVATSMAICREDTIDIHWVGTLPEYRNKGVGFAVSHFPISEQKQIKVAILYASQMGKPIYEKIGFCVLGLCHVYSSVE